MPSSVQPLGPLWATAMFQFEGYNSIIINSCDESQAIPKEIMKKLNWRRALLTLQQGVEQRSPDSLSLEQSLFKNVKPKKRLKLQRLSSHSVKASEKTLLRENFGHSDKELIAYDSLSFCDILLTTFSHEERYASCIKCNCYIHRNTY